MVLDVKFVANIVTRVLANLQGLNHMSNQTIITFEIIPAVYVKSHSRPKSILRIIFVSIQGRGLSIVLCVVIVFDTKLLWLPTKEVMMVYGRIAVRCAEKPLGNHLP